MASKILFDFGNPLHTHVTWRVRVSRTWRHVSGRRVTRDKHLEELLLDEELGDKVDGAEHDDQRVTDDAVPGQCALRKKNKI